MVNNDYNHSDDGSPPRSCPKLTPGDPLRGSGESEDDIASEETAYFLERYGSRMLEIPACVGWADWTSEEQRQSELYTFFYDLLPKDTDDPVHNDLVDGELSYEQECLENLMALREPPKQITHEAYLNIQEAQHV